MELEVILQHSNNRLTPAEFKFYLAACSLVGEENICYARAKTIASRASIHESTASRIVKKLERLGFLQKVNDGFLCLVGFDETWRNVKKTCSNVNFSCTDPECPTCSNVKKTCSNVKKTCSNVNSSLSLIEKEEREREDTPSPEQFQTSARNVRQLEQKRNLRSDELGKSEPVQKIESLFDITLGNRFAEILTETVTNAEHWTQFLKTKIAYADEPEPKRINMQRWIIEAYAEYCEKHPVPKPPRQLTAAELEVLEAERMFYGPKPPPPAEPAEDFFKDKSLKEIFYEMKAAQGEEMTIG